MKKKLLTAIALFFLSLAIFVLSAPLVRAQFSQGVEAAPAASPAPTVEPPVPAPLPEPEVVPSPDPTVAPAPPEPTSQFLLATCALQPPARPKTPTAPPPDMVGGAITLSRFRRPDLAIQISGPISATVSSYQPREEIALAHFTNYGERFVRDLRGKLLENDPIVVLHETVGSAQSAINFFQNAHFNEADQASYHALIRRNGNVVYLVPPDKRAFGAGNSIFRRAGGAEAVKTHPQFSASVNNFGYHISFETPSDGRHNYSSHSGYTAAQYQSAAWLVARTGVPDDRVTTHKAVDRSGSRQDPRSFDKARFMSLLKNYPRTSEIPIKCGSARP